MLVIFASGILCVWYAADFFTNTRHIKKEIISDGSRGSVRGSLGMVDTYMVLSVKKNRTKLFNFRF